MTSSGWTKTDALELKYLRIAMQDAADAVMSIAVTLKAGVEPCPSCFPEVDDDHDEDAQDDGACPHGMDGSPFRCAECAAGTPPPPEA